MHYWASPLEAKLCAKQEVALVGAGNSAGQAAVYLASQGAKVWMLVRGPSLAATMSRYLVDRIEGLPNIEVVTGAQVSGLEGRNGMLEAVRWRVDGAGQEVQRPIRHLFLFIGAEPNTDWLAGSGIALDAKGFVLTGADAGPIAIRWRPAGAASSPSATCAPRRSSASPPRSARARRSSRRCMPTWPRPQAIPLRRPTLWRQLEAPELKTRRDRAAAQRPVAKALRRLPSMSWHDRLRALASSKIVAERNAFDVSLALRDFERERRAGMPVPNFDRIDAMPVRALAARQQKVDRGRCRAVARPGGYRETSRENARLPDAA